MHQSFHVHHQQAQQCDSFLLHGIIDAHADQHLEEVVRLASLPTVQLDFSGVGRINSMGIALLLRSIKTLKHEKQAEVQISGLNQINSMLFKMTGIFLMAREVNA